MQFLRILQRKNFITLPGDPALEQLAPALGGGAAPDVAELEADLAELRGVRASEGAASAVSSAGSWEVEGSRGS